MAQTLAAVDLGSNSFRLQIGQVAGNQIYELDGLKETVRLASGLDAEKRLSSEAMARGFAALARFGEMLRGFAPDTVRAVATNTLRVAKNADEFLAQGEKALGFPIEVIAGREEARLIYLGVAHTLPEVHIKQLVVDIGGGSTEFIIGRSFQPQLLESRYMGCVGYSLRFFGNGRISKKAMQDAVLTASREVQTISHIYRTVGWEQAVGSSGTAKAIAELLELNGFTPPGSAHITRSGLYKLRDTLIAAGSMDRLKLEGLRPERVPVLPGGVAIMNVVFQELGLEAMYFSEGALRLGVLYDLLGRYHFDDMREATVAAFMQRYEIDVAQAARVGRAAQRFFDELGLDENDDARRLLNWAACLHETGISIAHASYHKHSAYILANADMPGFSRRDQQAMSQLIMAHRGKLERVGIETLPFPKLASIFVLRLAALLHRARDDTPDASVHVRALRHRKGFRLELDPGWLENAPLSAAALEEEQAQWANLGITLELRSQ